MGSSLTAGEASRKALYDAGERALLIDAQGLARTGTEIARRVTELAKALTIRGLAGQRVGLWYWNSPAALEAFLAVEWIGGSRVPVDPGAPSAEAARVFKAAGVQTVLTDREHVAELTGLALLHDDDEPLGATGAFEAPTVAPDTPLMLYPRMASNSEFMAVPLSYANWLATMDTNISLYRRGAYGRPLGNDECFLTAQQLMHGTGLLGSFPFLYMGLPQILLRRFMATDAVEAILRFGVTTTFFVPGMIPRLVEASDAARQPVAPPLHRVLYGGAPADAQVLRHAIDRLGSIFTQVYGRFEGGWPLAVLTAEDHLANADGRPLLGRSCGKPIAQTEIRIRPTPGHSPEAGELSVRNAMVARDYADPDGWCALGDIVRQDANGYLYLGGRLDGMINTGSYHVYPREVEDALTAIDGVREALVRGEPDPVWGQAVTAYITLASNADEGLVTALPAILERRLARYKIPKRISHVASLKDVPALN